MREVPIACSDEFYLNSRDYSLRHGPINFSANLFGTTDLDSQGIRFTPFNIDSIGPNEQSSPGRLIRDCISGRFVGRLDGVESVNGVEALMVAIGTSANAMRLRIGLSPSQGYLPVFISDTDKATGKRHHVAYILEARECSGQRWFPTKIVKVIRPDDAGPHYTNLIRITHLEVDTAPSKERFSLELPAGTQVNITAQTAWNNIDTAKTVTPEDLPAIYAQCLATKERYLNRREFSRQMQLAAGQAPPTSGARTFWLALTSIIVLSVATCILWLRRRKTAS